MFPTTDSSQTIIDSLLRSAAVAGVKLVSGRGVEGATRRSAGGFELTLSDGESVTCDRLLLATGGCRAIAAGQLAVSLGHTLEPPVPSLFTFHIEVPWLRNLAGISVASVEASVPGAGLRERGSLLVTHWGLSGPAVLRLSAWGARAQHQLDYCFALRINWLPHLSAETIAKELQTLREQQPARLLVNTPMRSLPARLWEQLVLAADVGRDTRWAALSRPAQHRLVQQLIRTEFPVTGKSLNKDEFVTCGGVRLGEVNLKTMESRICPGLYFAGELLDIDGITGGFNFQAAWTTGWIAGQAMAGAIGG
jgi:predicted Rossmann fold flavoprotein